MDLKLALRVSADVRAALSGLRQMQQRLGGARTATDRAARAARVYQAALDGTSRGASLLTRHLRYFAAAAGGLSFSGVIRNTVRQEQAVAQVEARIRATGAAAGRTSTEIQGMAAALQDVTAYGDEAILEMQALLLSFRALDGAQLERITETALDLATALGQGPREAAVQLAKALEDPVQGLTALRRSGTIFSASQTEVIRRLAETGRLAEAQRHILDELARQYGGAARAARDTLGGALAALGNAWGDLLEQADRAPEATAAIEALIQTLDSPGAARTVEQIAGSMLDLLRYMVEHTDGIVTVAGAIAGMVAGGQVARRLPLPWWARLAARLGGGALGALAGDAVLETDDERAAEVATLQRQLSAAVDHVQKLAESGQDTTLAEAQIARIVLRLRELEGGRPADDGRIRPDPADPRGQLPGAPPPPSGGDEPPEADRWEAELRRARARAEGLAHTRRQRAEEERRLDDDARERAARREALSGARGQLAAAEADLAGPWARALAEVARWEAGIRAALAAAGAGEEDYTRLALAAAARRARAGEAEARRRLETARDWQSGVRRALADLGRDWSDWGRAAEDATRTAFQGAEDALVGFVARGRLEIGDFGRFVAETLARAFVRQTFGAPLAEWAGRLFAPPGAGGAGAPSGVAGYASLRHAGGIAGEPGGVRRTGVPPAAWWGAPRLHAGGIPGLAAGEVPAILRRDEGVFTPAQMRALGAARGPTEVRISLETRTPAPLQVVEQRAQVDAGRLVIGLVVDDIERGGRIPRALGVGR